MKAPLTLLVSLTLFYHAAFAQFTYIEQMPTPPCDIQRFIAENMRYPQAAADSGIDGRVTVKFLVTKQGFLDSVHVVRGVHPLLDAEALRLINSLPQPWEPGRNLNKLVAVWFYMPVVFRLE